MEKKITYVEALEVAINVLDADEANAEVKEKLESLKASLEKKAEKKRASVDNTPYFDAVRNALSFGEKTPTELAQVIGVPTPQKVTAILKAMGSEVVKEAKGKKVTYRLA